MSEPLSAERLAEIRARAGYAGPIEWDDAVDAFNDRDVLLAEGNRLRAENARLAAPSCGGPDCRMTELHTVNTCPIYQERAETDAWYDRPVSRVSRWFSAAHDDRHGTDPAWDGTGE